MDSLQIQRDDLLSDGDGRKRYGRRLDLKLIPFVELDAVVSFEGEKVNIPAELFKGYLHPSDPLLDWKIEVKEGKLRVQMPQTKKFPVKALSLIHI